MTEKKLNFKTILLASLLAFTAVSAKEETTNDLTKSFHYLEAGTTLPLPYPGIGIGHREKYQLHAFDFSLSFSSILIMSDVSLNTKLLTYFRNQQYYGLGACSYFGRVYDVYFVCFSPFICYGKEYKKSFFEADFSPIRVNNYGIDFFPSLVLKYGFKY